MLYNISRKYHLVTPRPVFIPTGRGLRYSQSRNSEVGFVWLPKDMGEISILDYYVDVEMTNFANTTIVGP